MASCLPTDEDGLQGRPNWVPDKDATACGLCQEEFTFSRRRHHCRRCGGVFCQECSNYSVVLPLEMGYSGQQRVCATCNAPYAQKIHAFDTDILAAQFHMRSQGTYEYNKPLPDMGSRTRTINGGMDLEKSYVQARDIRDKIDLVVAVITPASCPWDFTSDKARSRFVAVMNSLQHPYILPILSCDCMQDRAKVVVYRKLQPKGSLKDVIYKTKPTGGPYDQRYPPGKRASGLAPKLIPRHAKQILEALLFLKSKGISMPHLHTGNIIMRENDVSCITDVENTLLGLRPLTQQVGSGEAAAFGAVLFEMASGYRMTDPTDVKDVQGTPLVIDTLRAIFPDAPDAPVPSLDDLAKFPLFTQTKLDQAPPSKPEERTSKKLLKFIQDYANKSVTPSEPEKISPRGAPTASPSSVTFSPSSGSSGGLPRSTSSSSGFGLAREPSFSTKAGVGPSDELSERAREERAKRRSARQSKRMASSTSLNEMTTPPPSGSAVVSPRGPSAASAARPPASPAPAPARPPTSAPAPPPPPSGAPPPPPPPSFKNAPPPQTGRNALLDSIRSADNVKKLKKTKK